MKILRGFHELSVKNKRSIIPPYKREKSVYEAQFRTMECQECLKMMKQISWNHLRKHGMTVDEYKIKYKIPFGEGLTGIQTKAQKRDRQLKLMAEGRLRLISGNDPRWRVSTTKKRRPPNLEEKMKRQSVTMKKLYHMSPELKEAQSKKMKEVYAKSDNLRRALAIGQAHEYVTCTVCLHPKRNDIEKEIREGNSDQLIGDTFDTHRTNVQRHRVNHMKILAEKGDKGYLRRKSERREMPCIVCGKIFVYYHYPYYKYDRKLCSNTCKSIYMKR